MIPVDDGHSKKLGKLNIIGSRTQDFFDGMPLEFCRR